MRTRLRVRTRPRRTVDTPAPKMLQAVLAQAVEAGFAKTSTPKLQVSAPPHEPLQTALPEADPSVAPPPPVAPDPLPIRMLNEFVYCPRLFFYEHVEGLFLDNADTVRGSAIHKRVDSGSGNLPAPAKSRGKEKDPAEEEAPPETIHSRSISLGSETLGVTAKLDLVEVRNGTGDLFDLQEVFPVDYKAGAPRENEDGPILWDTDKIQLGLQCLLLQEHGYTCSGGFIYYRATRQRIKLDLTEELKTWILSTIKSARTCAQGSIPPPLVDSPKCPRCSLAPICLPDETRLLQQPEPAQTKIAVRRLIAPADDTKALYLNTQGIYVSKKSDRLIIKEPDVEAREVRLQDLSNVSLFGNIQLTTQAIQSLCDAEIPISYYSMGGWFYGITRGHTTKNVFTRMAQFAAAADPVRSLQFARQFVVGKIRNQRTLLMRNHQMPPEGVLPKLKQAATTAGEAASLGSLLGIEGAAAALFFGSFEGMIKLDAEVPEEQGEPQKNEAQPWQPTFDFNGRNRRPPQDPVNALLSLAYSLLTKECTHAAASVGLDPYVGFYHQPRFGRPALALDVMEEFRPILADSAVLTAINNRMLGPHHFISAGKSVNLNPVGRKVFFEVFERRLQQVITHPVFEYKVSYRRAIELQFRLLARVLTGELEEYPPFTTR